VKAGDAKPWVYRHISDHDRQAAEDTKSTSLALFAWLDNKSQAFLSGWLLQPSETTERPEGFKTFGTFYA